MKEAFSGKPLVVGSIQGYRAFILSNDGGLRGLTFTSYRWESGENIAYCPSSLRPHDIENCSHGFWAYHTCTTRASGRIISGVISGYGETAIGTLGFRSSKARILALALDESFIEDYKHEQALRRMMDQYPNAQFFKDCKKMWEVFPPSEEYAA